MTREVDALVCRRERTEGQRRDVADAVEAVQRGSVPNSEKNEMPHATDTSARKWPDRRAVIRPSSQAITAGNEQAGKQADNRRRGGKFGEQRGGIGGEPDEARLPERGLAADAGQQHEAERDQRRQADVAGERDVEGRQQQ